MQQTIEGFENVYLLKTWHAKAPNLLWCHSFDYAAFVWGWGTPLFCSLLI
jgi:hypothetical protein